MSPPIRDGVPEMGAPIAKWVQESAHDTAKSCEEERWKYADRTLKTLTAKRGIKRGDSLSPDDPMFTYSFGARCVPAEHIYPPAMPVQQ